LGYLVGYPIASASGENADIWHLSYFHMWYLNFHTWLNHLIGFFFSWCTARLIV
jgi:hypothetical protein